MSYKVGEKLPKQPVVTNQEWDSVFILLPCENKRYSLDDLSNIQKKFQAKHSNLINSITICIGLNVILLIWKF